MGKITHGSLFSGIGGFDLSAEWAGLENLFHCEINEFGRKVLNYYWPNAISYEDITKTDFTIWRGKIDVLTGGFPCQPYSMAGKRLGKEDERHLWPEMLRVIREVQPTWVVGENVPGLINWSGGLVFDEVQTDLESAGYEVIPFILPAAGVNAPHRRDRVWFVACSECIRGEGLFGVQPEKSIREESVNISKCRTTSNSSNTGLQGGKNDGSPGSIRTKSNKQPSRFFCTDWQDFPTQPPVCSRNDGTSDRLVGITFSKWRNESIKACGNAIVPQVVYQIFKAINEYEQNKSLHQHPDNRP